ncbi:MAG: hypothetical protein AB2697_23105 [Candidatus Thiodiazotropha endolucinida]
MNNIELLRPILLQGLLSTEVPPVSLDFKQWVSGGNYIVRDIPSRKTIKIEVNNDYSFNHMITFDSCRMACASFETMNNIQSISSLPKSIGWIAIKSYYAAFFSAHSIMRCFGYICSQLKREHIEQLNNYGLAVGLTHSFQPEAGVFAGEFEPTSRILLLKKMNNTHEDTWNTLVTCLKMISTKVLSVSGLSTHKQQISSVIDDIVIKLTDDGRLAKGNYLSQFRNAVNYRQEHDAWHPYGKNSIKADKVVNLLSTWPKEDRVSPSIWKESKDAYNFFLTCRDLVSLNQQIINLIVANSDNVSTLYKRWPIKLLHITSAA